MKIAIPDFCMVVLVGASSAGKSTFAARHFKPSEIISSDACRAVVSDDENDQAATGDAFELVHYIAGKRLQRRKLVVVDATNVRSQDRAHLIQLARKYHAKPVAITIDPGVDIIAARHAARRDRTFDVEVVREQVRALAKSQPRMDSEGFKQTHHLKSAAEIDAVEIIRERLEVDRRDERGPFDIIGDIHGCCDELVALLGRLGYSVTFLGEGENRSVATTAPEGRRAIFVGDLVDRGPRSPDALRLVMAMVASGQALCVPGNHDVKLLRWLNGRNVRLTHGLEKTVAQLDAEPDSFRPIVRNFLDGLKSHLWLEGGKLAVAHAGVRGSMLGRMSGAVREFCLYGETSGETDEFGLPIRYNWAAEYQGDTAIIYGHTPVPDAEWLNNTLCIDTGCCFGGKLTALRWPEGEIVSEAAHAVHAEPMRPFGHPPARAIDCAQADGERDDHTLDLETISGARVITTEIGPTVTIQAQNAGAALEVLTRFAVAPEWLAYLPPTLPPPPRDAGAVDAADELEHPRLAFRAYKERGVNTVAVHALSFDHTSLVVVCQDGNAAAQHFGVDDGTTGALFDPLGVRLYPDTATTERRLAGIRKTLDQSNFWDRHKTSWAIFEAHVVDGTSTARPSHRTTDAPQALAQAQALQREFATAIEALDTAHLQRQDSDALRERLMELAKRADALAHAATRSIVAQTHPDPQFIIQSICATEGHLCLGEAWPWQADAIGKLVTSAASPLAAVDSMVIDLDDTAALRQADAWWEERARTSAPGAVVRPADIVVRGDNGLVQPAFKCRTPAQLRLVYGADFDRPDNFKRIAGRSLGLKQALSLREFALGHEALRRFIAREPLHRVHECIFALLAFEAEPTDPRL